MNNVLDIMEKATEFGFTEVAQLDCATIDLKQDVRDMCAANTCGQYGKNWSCPPGCGSMDECKKKVLGFSNGIIVQSVGTLEDSMDYDGMMEAQQIHTERYKQFAKYLQENLENVLCLGAGCCTVCKQCTYPDKPCRFPEKNISSMESYGIFVSELCKLNNMKYYYGENTICYVGCYLF